MTTKKIKSNIYKALENIDDSKFLKAVFEIVSAKAEIVQSFEISEEQKAILEEREKEYSHGKGKNYTWEAAKKIIRTKKNAA
ncbi:MAG: hypothetical protein A3F72_12005 [Bacteroidetes bacterium RIFCSPLOWO2_12_FULL_35_15]|nr:MAG: hypothetical protein A3F72_12005 [Bacteroidetes bacterium RIFCSPLOWO2_12_FULL_35_15]